MNSSSSNQWLGKVANTEKSRLLALRVILLYCLLAGLWIVFSDRSLASLVIDSARLTTLHIYKGLALVAATSGLFYFILRHQARSLEREISERTRTENALRESNEKFQQLADNITDAFWIRSPDMREVHYVSPAFERIWGRPVASLYGNPLQWADYILPEDRDRVLGAFVSLMGDTRSLDIEYRIVRPDGEIRWVRVRGFQVRDAADKLIRHTGIVTDITERRCALEKLRESEERFSGAFEHAPIGVALVSPEGRWLKVNRALCDLVGYSEAELLTRTFQDITHPEDIDANLEYVRRLLAGEIHTYQMEKRYIHGSGHLIAVLLSVSLVRDGRGQPSYFISQIQDITERKRAEDELRWKTAFLEAQVDSALDGILVVDRRGQKILQNQRHHELWKIPPYAAENYTEQLQFFIKQTKRPEEFIKKVSYMYTHPDEVIRDEVELVNGTILDRYSSPVRDKAGKYYGRIWTFRDITEHRRLEGQLRQSQKMEAFGQLAGGVAHDFNNILAVIQMQAGLLREEQALAPMQMDFATEIEKAARRGASLTRQLLLFSRRQTLQPRDLDLNDIITNIAKMLHRLLGEDVHMQFKSAPQPMFIHADAGMMDQILLNLTVNARDAMPGGGQLIVETYAFEFDEITAAQTFQARPGSFVCLSVSDTGCGIPPEILPRIFEPFFTTKDVDKGTGLGLATVFGIVQQHQGWINVYSEVGRGTAFRVYLPRLTRVSLKTVAGSSPATVAGGNETILLVEDDPTLRATTRIALTRFGYRVLEAPNGVEALEVWKQNRNEIRLLLTDLVMPGGTTGSELAGQLLQHDPKLKVIYTSGYSAEIASKDLPLEEGVNFLAKPFEARQLAQTVRNCLNFT